MLYIRIVNFFEITKFLLIGIHLNYLFEVEIIKFVKLSFIGKYLKVIKTVEIAEKECDAGFLYYILTL